MIRKITALCSVGATPYVAQTSAIDRRTTRHFGYGIADLRQDGRMHLWLGQAARNHAQGETPGALPALAPASSSISSATTWCASYAFSPEPDDSAQNTPIPITNTYTNPPYEIQKELPAAFLADC
jgi:hypothetical protein